MADLTTDELNDIRLDVGIPADNQTVFTDAELQRLWVRVETASSTLARQNAVRGLALWQLLASAAKLHDYTLVSTEEKESQVFKNLLELYKRFSGALEDVLGGTISQVVFSGLGVRPVERNVPNTAEGDIRLLGNPPYPNDRYRVVIDD